MLAGSRIGTMLVGSRICTMLAGSRIGTMLAGSRIRTMLAGSRIGTMLAGSRIRTMLAGSPPDPASDLAYAEAIPLTRIPRTCAGSRSLGSRTHTPDPAHVYWIPPAPGI